MKTDIQSIRTEVQLGTRQISLLQNSLHENHTAVVKIIHDHELADLRNFAPIHLANDMHEVETRLTKLEATYKHIAGRRGQSGS
jgi:hypothetical protein